MRCSSAHFTFTFRYRLFLFCLLLAASQLMLSRAESASRTTAGKPVQLHGMSNTVPPSSTHWIIVVQISPRPGADGSASIRLLDNQGNLSIAFPGTLSAHSGLAIGIKGPARDVQFGDTPFGVYKFVETAGGTPDDRLGSGYGTGKIYLHDKDMFGEVADAKRSLIRLHGGGSVLPEPYAAEQPLRATKGCVRMTNRDVNSLIQKITSLTPQTSVKYVFMGNDSYLNSLAQNTQLASQAWWSVLRTALHLPQVNVAPQGEAAPLEEALIADSPQALYDSAPAAMAANAATAPSSSGVPNLLRWIKVFTDDVGKKGELAMQELAKHQEDLLKLQTLLPKHHPLQPRLSFVLCYFNHDCAANRKVLELALGSESPYDGFFADQAQDLISRLIDKADAEGKSGDAEEMLGQLLRAAPSADGALADGLGLTFSTKLLNRTGLFMSSFQPFFSPHGAATDPQTRMKVYELILMTNYLSNEDNQTIEKRLKTMSSTSADLKDAVKEFRKSYFKAARQ